MPHILFNVYFVFPFPQPNYLDFKLYGGEKSLHFVSFLIQAQKLSELKDLFNKYAR